MLRDYILVCAESSDHDDARHKLQEAVMDHVKGGYLPQGGPLLAVSKDAFGDAEYHFYQAMVLPPAYDPPIVVTGRKPR